MVHVTEPLRVTVPVRRLSLPVSSSSASMSTGGRGGTVGSKSIGTVTIWLASRLATTMMQSPLDVAQSMVPNAGVRMRRLTRYRFVADPVASVVTLMLVKSPHPVTSVALATH
jgi:hypothetical protein